jgi:hypothetical protein
MSYVIGKRSYEIENLWGDFMFWTIRTILTALFLLWNEPEL